MLIFRAETELDSVVEMGWYKKPKRLGITDNDLEDRALKEDFRKRIRREDSSKDCVKHFVCVGPLIMNRKKRNTS